MNWRTLVICGLLVGALGGALHSEPASKVDRLTISEIQKRIEAFKQKTELPAAVKEPVISFLERAVERLEIEQEQMRKAEEFERRLPLVADQLQKVTKELRSLPPTIDPSVADIEGVDELEHTVELLSKQIDDPQTGLRKKISELEEEMELRRVRPEQLMNDLVEVEDRLREIEEELEEVPASGEARDLMHAHQVFLMARRQRAESERRALQAEAAWHESGTAADLLQAQQELETKTLALKTAELELLQKELVKRRGDEADQRVYHAQTILNQISPDLKPIAEQNLALANEHRDVTHKLHDNNGRYEATSNTANELGKEFANTRKMIEKVDATDAIGQLLRQQRAKLSDVRLIRSNISHRSDVVRDIRLRQFQLGLDIDALIDLDASAAKQAEAIDAAKQNKSVAAGLKKLLNEQRELLKGLESEYRKYFAKLVEMDVADKGLLKLTTEYSTYIDERILWIRSGQTFNFDQLGKLPASVRWLSDTKSWNSVRDAINVDISRRTFTWLSVGLGLLMWVFLNPILRSMLRNRGHVASPTWLSRFVADASISRDDACAGGWLAVRDLVRWLSPRSWSVVVAFRPFRRVRAAANRDVRHAAGSDSRHLFPRRSRRTSFRLATGTGESLAKEFELVFAGQRGLDWSDWTCGGDRGTNIGWTPWGGPRFCCSRYSRGSLA